MSENRIPKEMAEKFVSEYNLGNSLPKNYKEPASSKDAPTIGHLVGSFNVIARILNSVLGIFTLNPLNKGSLVVKVEKIKSDKDRGAT